MTVVARLEAILSANTAQFEGAMARSETRIQKTGRVAGVAGLAIAGGLAYGLEKSVKAALAAQTSQARLEQAFKTSHISAARYAAEVTMLETRSRKLGFTDEQVKESLGSLLVATHSMRLASHDLSIAQDIARFKHVDLAAATKMLSMAMAGSQRATKQLGISVQAVTTQEDALKAQHNILCAAQKKATDSTYKHDLATAKLIDHQKTASVVIQTVKDRLSGQADTYSQTAAGGMEQFRAQLDHLEVSMGTGLLPILAQVSAEMAKATDYFSKHAKMTKVLAAALGVLAAALLAARVAQLLMNLAVLANPYVAAIAAVVAAGIAIYVFRDKLMNAYNWIKDHWTLLSGILAGPIGLAVAEIIKHRNRLIEIFTNLPGQIAGAFTAGIGAVKDAIVGLFGKVIGWVKSALGIGSPSKVFHKIGQQSIQGFINGVGSMGGILKNAVIHIAESALSHLNPFSGGHRYPPHKGSGTPSENKRFALGQMGRFGWGTDQFPALNALWTQESGWSQYAKNKSSGAYGIPQALPPTKMPFAAQEGGGSSAVAQIIWGLNYIKGRYGNPVGAEAHEQAYNWYDRGGWLPTGLSLAMNNTGRPERVVPPGGGGDTVILQVGTEEVARVVFDQIRGKAQIFQRRNGRPAFGGA